MQQALPSSFNTTCPASSCPGTSFLTKRPEKLPAVDRVPEGKKVLFEALVTLKDEGGETVNYRIVGQDEFDVKASQISMDSPITRSLLGQKLDGRLEEKNGRLTVSLKSLTRSSASEHMGEDKCHYSFQHQTQLYGLPAQRNWKVAYAKSLLVSKFTSAKKIHYIGHPTGSKNCFIHPGPFPVTAAF
ncbi:GreA/GreB family elongation factor [Microbulbifer sp. GL-2]|uniref:GreA/GreB family elongation factor n=1 Tax=Microbulbifer sp. GL-2 TaxID=2591606 RepID=UPI0011642D02|nr:GreA/GreB family elongation factor [Microbulbifer sp. GL-2]BBM02392.1 hypothetical protein GL2_24660 [Microbulbifer sp. GL-2]